MLESVAKEQLKVSGDGNLTETKELQPQPKPDLVLLVKPSSCGENEHPLEFTYVFSYFVRPQGKFDPEDYALYVQPVASFNSVEQFWNTYYITEKVDFHMFKEGIKPVWEDDANRKGGKWILRLKKGFSSRIWENLILAMIGEQFLVGEEICGAVCSIRNQEDIVSLWNRTADNLATTNRIRDTLRRVLNLPPNAILEYKRHDDCLKHDPSVQFIVQSSYEITFSLHCLVASLALLHCTVIKTKVVGCREQQIGSTLRKRMETGVYLSGRREIKFACEGLDSPHRFIVPRLPITLFTTMILLLLLLPYISADAKVYHVGDKVEVFVNKIGPYANKHETYHYYQLPLCRPAMVVHRSLSLGQLLNGDRMAESSYLLHFGKQKGKTSLCGKYKITSKDLDDLISAVEDNFYLELVVDNIRVHNYLGFIEEQNTFPHMHRAYLYTHFIFAIDYDQETGELYRVTLQADQDSVSNLSAKPDTIELFYSVVWTETKQIKNDLNRYNGKTLNDFTFESGWKSISTDVFRLPKFSTLFASIVGVGSQFLLLITIVLVIGSTKLISARNHEILNSVAVLLYAVTSGVAGFTSAYIYRQFGGKNWIVNTNVTTSLFTVPMILIWVLNNSVSWAYGSTQALPYTTVMGLALFWLFVGYPLTIVGAAIGKNCATSYSAPCRTRNIPRQLPQLPFYKASFVLMLFGGFLSFSALSMELYYIFSTIWGRESYMIYYVMLIAFLIMVAVVATSSISLIYVKLSAEDYRWWWLSVFVGG
uniref:Transmembrane 9 superfamily member n=1 Tax=Setaria digitata TaxID=48799 RepID=A0A915PWY7_9BILA